jgi:hypothetical protein
MGVGGVEWSSRAGRPRYLFRFEFFKKFLRRAVRLRKQREALPYLQTLAEELRLANEASVARRDIADWVCYSCGSRAKNSIGNPKRLRKGGHEVRRHHC